MNPAVDNAGGEPATPPATSPCLTPHDLPPSPPGKTGWPWTEGSAAWPATQPDGSAWPQVSIVTPSYNQGQFLEETIRSVLLQGYPRLEYIIVDGGSTDNSVEIIKKYEKWLAYWMSEPDEGQTDAILKGLGRSGGEIVAYLNSDDVYLQGAVGKAVSVLASDADLALVSGDMLFVDSDGKVVGRLDGLRGDFFKSFLDLTNPIPQPSSFVARWAFDAAGGLDPGLHMLMDYDLYCRIALHGMRMQGLAADLSRFRLHRESKTTVDMLRFAQEREILLAKYLSDPVLKPKLTPYARQLHGVMHLRLAAAHWLCAQDKEAYRHYWTSIRTKPGLLPSRRSLSLVSRFVLRRRYFRQPLAERVK